MIAGKPYLLAAWINRTSHWHTQEPAATLPEACDQAAACYANGEYLVVIVVRWGIIQEGWPTKEAAIGFEATHPCSLLQNREKRTL